MTAVDAGKRRSVNGAHPVPRFPRPESRRPREALFLRWARRSDTTIAVVMLISAFLATNLGRMPWGFHEFLAMRLTVKNLLLLIGFAAIWRLVCTLVGLYTWPRIRLRRREAARILLATAIGSAVALVFPAISLTGAFRVFTVAVWLTGTSAVIWLTRALLRMLIDVEANEPRNFLVVGTGPMGLALGEELAASPETRLVGYVDAGPAPAGVELGVRYLGEVRDLDRILLEHAVDQVYVALPLRSRYVDFEAALQACERTGVSASWLADQFASTPGNHRRQISGNGSVINISPEPDYRLLIIKRTVDVVGAAAGLVVAAPVLALAAMAIKLTDGGPVLYVQARHGQYRRPFRMYKLRTMVDGADSLQQSLENLNEASGPVFKIRDDPRITRVGRFLRRTSIDELPQLLNVLRGDMSLVGPRPLPLRDVARFTEAALVRRFSVRPGLTGLWQVSGRSDVPFDRWIEMDLEYIDRWSLALDGKIILKTLPAVLNGTGAT